MSIASIGAALKSARNECHFLLELRFNDYSLRYAQQAISVPSSAGAPKIFHPKILSMGSIGQTFDLSSWRYSSSDVQVELANDGRLQDYEKQFLWESGEAYIYIWCEGLTWEDIETHGVVYRGVITLNGYSETTFSLTLEDIARARMQTLPPYTIDETSWPNHRTDGVETDYAGMAAQMVFGYALEVPLICVDTAAYTYLISMLKASAISNIRASGGAAITAGTSSTSIDGDGNVATIHDFAGDKSSQEPIKCSCGGIIDPDGAFTGTAAGVIEHPVHIAHFLLDSFGCHDYLDTASIATAAAVIGPAAFAVILNSSSSGFDVIDRILGQVMAARCAKRGKCAIVAFDTNAADIAGRIAATDILDEPVIEKTSYDQICNDLVIQYQYKTLTGRWKRRMKPTLVKDQMSLITKKSVEEYGKRPQVVLQLLDVNSEVTAFKAAQRYLDIHAFRHDLVKFSVAHDVGFLLEEFEAYSLNVPIGASTNGAGWVDEKCILLQKTFERDRVETMWWRVGVY